MAKWIIKLRQEHREDFITLDRGTIERTGPIAQSYEKPGVMVEIYKLYKKNRGLEKWTDEKKA